jgi:hypothetical protein
MSSSLLRLSIGSIRWTSSRKREKEGGSCDTAGGRGSLVFPAQELIPVLNYSDGTLVHHGPDTIGENRRDVFRWRTAITSFFICFLHLQ